MLLTFKGKGCSECPFVREVPRALGLLYCTLSYSTFADGYTIGALSPDEEQKPKDCPFSFYPNTLEIEAFNED